MTGRAASPLYSSTFDLAPLPSGTLPERGLDAFAAAISARTSVRIDTPTLWRAFASAFPRHPSGATQRQWFLTALEELERRGTILLPSRSGRRWDRGAVPPIPTSVDRVLPAAAAADDSWRGAVWHPALQWVPDLLRLTEEEVTFLRRVHEGLVHDTFTVGAPFKYRSLTLTGDEKRLGALASGRLFAPGRLTLSLLGTEPDVPPLAWTTIRSTAAPCVLVFENAGPSDLAIRLLLAMRVPTWDVVAYGAGRPFGSAVVRLAALQPHTISYVGDLDPDGVAIASAADAAARAVVLPPVAPARGFHAAMLKEAAALGAPDGWLPEGDKEKRIRRLAAEPAAFTWLSEADRVPVRRIALQGRRIPEEVLGPAAMRTLLDA